MGCNQNANRSRERAPETPNSRGQARAVATSPDQEDSSMLLGTSYTDERQIEAEAFKNILDKTSRNLIDVSQQSTRMNADLVIDRMTKYKNSLRRVMLPEIDTGRLPYSKAVEPVQFGGDVDEAVIAIAKRIGDSVMVIQDCGDLVVALPDIQADSSNIGQPGSLFT